MRVPWTLPKIAGAILIVVFAGFEAVTAQDSSSSGSWSSSTQQSSPDDSTNPFRTQETHRDSNGRASDRTATQILGPDGRYVPYSDIEKQSIRVNDSTVRNIERIYGTGPDGQRTLIQQRQEETQSLPNGEQKTTRSVSNPDANGALQLVQRELVDSKQLSPGVRDTKTTVYSADGNGGFSPSMRTEERQKQNDPNTVEFKKSTLLSDGAGNWTLSEIREGTTKKDAQGSQKSESVLRPDANGNMSVVERTVTRDTGTASDKRDTVDTYSTNVPGEANDKGLQLVQRDTTVQRGSGASQRTVHQTEQTNPGDPESGLHVTGQAIDIVRPGANGVEQQKTTISTVDANGNTSAVSVDFGKSDKPATPPPDAKPATKQN